MFKKFVTILLLVVLLTPLFYLPSRAPKAEAFLGFGDFVVDVPDWVDRITDAIAMAIAQQMIDHMAQSTIKWAQSGFHGNPAYMTNPKQYFSSIANGVAGEYIKGTDLGFLCSPFQKNIRLSLAQQYAPENQFQCTLDGVIGNIENFYNDFSQGGWDAWFSMTQNPVNNPYGAFVQADLELDTRIASALGMKAQELNWNQGFLSFKRCTLGKNTGAPTSTAPVGTGDPGDDGSEITWNFPDDPETGCIGGLSETATPGSVVQSQLNEVLPAGLKKLQVAQHIDQLISAFASGLLNRYVFGTKGLFETAGGNQGSSGKRTGMVDVDGDSIPDGQDFDYDGKLESGSDVCLHGGRVPNCTPSVGLTSSPYFTPVCQAVDQSVATLKEYRQFLERREGDLRSQADFSNKADAEIWADRTSETDSGVKEVLSSLRDRHSEFFDPMELVTNRFSNYIGKIMKSLIQDGDLDLTRLGGNGGGGINNLEAQVDSNLGYFEQLKAKLGKCEKPDISGIPSVPLPLPPPDDGEGGQCAVEGMLYQEALRNAENAVIAANPDVANLPNIESGDRQNARTFLALVASELQSRGYEATTAVLNGNNNPNTGDLIAVWKTGDGEMERYDAISGSAPTIRAAAMADFTGFIPLACTPSGGSRECGCSSGGGGGGGGGEEGGGGGGGTGGALSITSVSPTTVVSGATTLTITGTELTSTVQFFDVAGNRNTVIGNLNSTKTQVSVLVPGGMPSGAGRVRVYQNATSISNEKPITITGSGGGGPTIPTVTPISTWSPTQTNNGWWPKLSPNGRYVTYGNWGGSWVTDLSNGQNFDFSLPAELPTGSRCLAGHWITTTTLTYVCETGTVQNPTGLIRYVATIGEWIARRTTDNSALVTGSVFLAKDGHWASYMPATRIAKDNAILVSGGTGGSMSMSGNTVVHACNNENTTICVRNGNTLSKTIVPQVPFYETATNNGYILYGGSGNMRGVTPSGADTSKKIGSFGFEGKPVIFFVKGVAWIATSVEDRTNPSSFKTYVILRPWDSKSAIVIGTGSDATGATSLDVVFDGTNFVVAYNATNGVLKVVTVAENATRTQF